LPGHSVSVNYDGSQSVAITNELLEGELEMAAINLAFDCERRYDAVEIEMGIRLILVAEPE
jgi:hypothetical protein